ISITSDGTRILSGGDDKTVRVWSADNFKNQSVLTLDAPVLSVIALPDNEQVFIGLSFPLEMVELWRSASPTKVQWKTAPPSAASHVATDRKGMLGISGHYNGDILLWSLQDSQAGRVTASLKSHSSIVRSIQTTADGRFAVSGSEDKTI